LLNGDAENGTADWVEDAGSFESIASGDCGGINAYSGSRLFAVGGVCDNNSYAEGHQDIDVTAYASDIASGGISAHYGGRLSNYDGDDHPEFKLEFYDELQA
jgi:acid phosphatase type 7